MRVNGPVLRFVRESRGRSISSLARQVGVTQPFLSMVELGVRFSLRAPVLEAVARELEVDPALLTDTPVSAAA